VSEVASTAGDKVDGDKESAGVVINAGGSKGDAGIDKK
jgi:hypothetical protein